jgi:hypothetical protein
VSLKENPKLQHLVAYQFHDLVVGDLVEAESIEYNGSTGRIR